MDSWRLERPARGRDAADRAPLGTSRIIESRGTIWMDILRTWSETLGISFQNKFEAKMLKKMQHVSLLSKIKKSRVLSQFAIKRSWIPRGISNRRQKEMNLQMNETHGAGLNP
jgi:hypothetical protein